MTKMRKLRSESMKPRVCCPKPLQTFSTKYSTGQNKHLRGAGQIGKKEKSVLGEGPAIGERPEGNWNLLVSPIH